MGTPARARGVVRATRVRGWRRRSDLNLLSRGRAGRPRRDGADLRGEALATVDLHASLGEPAPPGGRRRPRGAPPRHHRRGRTGGGGDTRGADASAHQRRARPGGPQWHISITLKGKRPKPNHVRAVLRDFGMVGAEEDNHHPGNARHFWIPCDPTRRVDCECKATEVIVVDPDGYTWTNPTPESGEGCRGCEWARAPLARGKACPIHGG